MKAAVCTVTSGAAQRPTCSGGPREVLLTGLSRNDGCWLPQMIMAARASDQCGALARRLVALLCKVTAANDASALPQSSATDSGPH